jgi:hypothetical protein
VQDRGGACGHARIECEYCHMGNLVHFPVKWV